MYGDPGHEEYLMRLEAEDRMATPGEAAREYAYNVGMDNPDRAWVLTDYDTWERNPFYNGPPVPHPEDYEYDEEPTGPSVGDGEGHGSEPAGSGPEHP